MIEAHERYYLRSFKLQYYSLKSYSKYENEIYMYVYRNMPETRSTKKCTNFN